MKRLKARPFLVLLVMVIITVNSPTYAKMSREEKFFPVSEIQPKMKGVGYTVVAGTKIESFSVEVVGLLQGSGSVRRLILVKVSGKALEGGGGISAGMSGSPIYFKNRLAGALSYGFQNANPYYALVTPIAEMMTIWDYPQRTDLVYTFYRGGAPGIKGVTFDRKNIDNSLLKAEPVSLPMLINGKAGKQGRSRSAEYLLSLFADQTIIPIFAGNSNALLNEKPPELRPGSAVSVILADGDYQVTALGTLTCVEDGNFLAFGHPFLNRGQVEYGFGGAYIYTVIFSEVFPFKIGAGYPAAGRVTQDRGAGIAGDFQSLPEFVEVSLKVSDADSQRTEERSFRVIRDERLIPGLVLAGILDAEDSVLDRIGPGTANARLRLEGENINPILRENIFYSQDDVAAASLKEMDLILQLLAGNKYTEVNLTEVSMEVEVTSQRLSAELVGVEIPKTDFLPGEEFILTGKILPYRGATEKEIPIPLEIPKEFTPGEWLLSIHGGGCETFWEEKKGKETPEIEFGDSLPSTATSLEQLISELISQPTNNRLVVELLPLSQPHEVEERGGYDEAPLEKNDSLSLETKKWTAETAYFLVGEEQLVIQLLDPQRENGDDDGGDEESEEFGDFG